MAPFEPKIIAFLCNWCSYAGADLAGTARLQYPTNVRIVRLMCSGALDSAYVVRALVEGADGVFVGGCHPGDCHYLNGNFKARRRIAMLETILAGVGLQPERVMLRWISASEGQKFAQTMQEFTDRIRTMGKNPLTAKATAAAMEVSA